MERLNQSAAAGEDVDYLKDPKFLQPISRAPFYGAEIRPATVCFTAFGLRIDRDAQVLSEVGQADSRPFRRRARVSAAWSGRATWEAATPTPTA